MHDSTYFRFTRRAKQRRGTEVHLTYYIYRTIRIAGLSHVCGLQRYGYRYGAARLGRSFGYMYFTWLW